MPRSRMFPLLAALTAVLAGGVLRAAEKAPLRKPNLVLIVADDKD